VRWNPYGSEVRIEVLHVPGCPNLEASRERLQAAIEAAGVTASVHETPVADERTAASAGMRGSPTILVDGTDPFLAGRDPSLSCRLYRTPRGLEGLPTLAQLVEVLSR